jgi:MraZ protein
MLTGSIDVAFDRAGRMTIPARHRASLGEDVIICPALPPASNLLLFDAARFPEFLAGVLPAECITDEELDLKRRLVGGAYDAKVDKAGRVLVPEMLREYAGIDGAAKSVGMLTHLEIWAAGLHDDWDREGRTPEGAERMRRARQDLRARRSLNGPGQ